MRIQYPLATVTPTLDGDVLTVLALADTTFTIGSLQGLIPGRSAEGIRKTVTRLVGEGVVLGERVGRTGSYRLNREHVAAPGIIALAHLADTLFERIRETIAAWGGQVVFTALFGSAARGDMRTNSDIDIFVVVADDADDANIQDRLADLMTKVRAWTGNDARILAFTERETVGAADAEPVLQSVADEGRTILGDLTEFRRTIRGQRG